MNLHPIIHLHSILTEPPKTHPMSTTHHLHSQHAQAKPFINHALTPELLSTTAHTNPHILHPVQSTAIFMTFFFPNPYPAKCQKLKSWYICLDSCCFLAVSFKLCIIQLLCYVPEPQQDMLCILKILFSPTS